MEEATRIFALTATVVWLGACTVFPMCLCVLFWRSRHPIGRSVAWMAFGVAFNMLAAMSFGMLELCGAMEGFPWWAASIIRAAMGAMAFGTSLHLALTTHDIVVDYENERSNRDV